MSISPESRGFGAAPTEPNPSTRNEYPITYADRVQHPEIFPRRTKRKILGALGVGATAGAMVTALMVGRDDSNMQPSSPERLMQPPVATGPEMPGQQTSTTTTSERMPGPDELTAELRHLTEASTGGNPKLLDEAASKILTSAYFYGNPDYKKKVINAFNLTYHEESGLNIAAQRDEYQEYFLDKMDDFLLGENGALTQARRMGLDWRIEIRGNDYAEKDHTLRDNPYVKIVDEDSNTESEGFIMAPQKLALGLVVIMPDGKEQFVPMTEDEKTTKHYGQSIPFGRFWDGTSWTFAKLPVGYIPGR